VRLQVEARFPSVPGSSAETKATSRSIPHAAIGQLGRPLQRLFVGSGLWVQGESESQVEETDRGARWC
jgi:hypothetical protein